MTEDVIVIDSPPTYGRTPRELLRNPNVSPQAKALWGLLEDFASPASPQPFPGQATLAGHMGADVRTIRRWLRELSEAGWLSATGVVTEKGRRNVYTLHWQRQSVAAGVRTSVSGGVRTQVSRGVRTSVSGEEEPVEEEPCEEENTSASDDDGIVGSLFEPCPAPLVASPREQMIHEAFEEFWQAYPRKRDRTPAYKAFRRAIARGVDSRCMIEGAKRYAAEIKASGTKKDHVKYGERWINAEAWQNVAEETRSERLVRLAKELGEQSRTNGAAG